MILASANGWSSSRVGKPWHSLSHGHLRCMPLDKMLVGLMYLGYLGWLQNPSSTVTGGKALLSVLPCREEGLGRIQVEEMPGSHQHQACCRRGYLFHPKYIICVLDRRLSGS